MTVGRLVSHGENVRISLVLQMGGTKFLPNAPQNASPVPTFTYMDEVWWTYVSYPDLQESLFRASAKLKRESALLN